MSERGATSFQSFSGQSICFISTWLGHVCLRPPLKTVFKTSWITKQTSSRAVPSAQLGERRESAAKLVLGTLKNIHPISVHFGTDLSILPCLALSPISSMAYTTFMYSPIQNCIVLYGCVLCNYPFFSRSRSASVFPSKMSIVLGSLFLLVRSITVVNAILSPLKMKLGLIKYLPCLIVFATI